MKKILILGKTGMLGSMLYYHFSKKNDYNVFSTSRENSDKKNLFFDAIGSDINALSDFVKENRIEYIINAVGIVKHYCKNDDMESVKKAIMVNALFPHKLAALAKKEVEQRRLPRAYGMLPVAKKWASEGNESSYEAGVGKAVLTKTQNGYKINKEELAKYVGNNIDAYAAMAVLVEGANGQQ